MVVIWGMAQCWKGDGDDRNEQEMRSRQQPGGVLAVLPRAEAGRG
jgi:hypothetical protein